MNTAEGHELVRCMGELAHRGELPRLRELVTKIIDERDLLRRQLEMAKTDRRLVDMQLREEQEGCCACYVKEERSALRAGQGLVYATPGPHPVL